MHNYSRDNEIPKPQVVIRSKKCEHEKATFYGHFNVHCRLSTYLPLIELFILLIN